MQEEITALQTELSKGSNTMGEERRRDLARQIDEKNRTLTRSTEDAEMEVQQEQAKMFESMGQKLMAIITKHATESGFTLILNVADPQTPVLFAANGYDITQAVIKLYDEQNPVTAAAAAPATPEP
jgi:Skp family chaperone for outer membrane proteins